MRQLVLYFESTPSFRAPAVCAGLSQYSILAATHIAGLPKQLFAPKQLLHREEMAPFQHAINLEKNISYSIHHVMCKSLKSGVRVCVCVCVTLTDHLSLNHPHFQCSIATRGLWLLHGTAQLVLVPSFPESLSSETKMLLSPASPPSPHPESSH